jgi:3-dehydroquinate dehydratase-2
VKILIINGPNLNLLGKREAIYGELTLEEINSRIEAEAKKLGVEVDFYQSNYEGDLIDKIQAANKHYDALIINPGGLTHYSVSLRDALATFKGKKIEVHLTNIFAREEFRRRTITGEAVDGVIAGLGPDVYLLALRALGAENV